MQVLENLIGYDTLRAVLKLFKEFVCYKKILILEVYPTELKLLRTLGMAQ